MKHISAPPLILPQVEGNLSDLPIRNGVSRPEEVAFSKPSSGTWEDVTNAEFLAEVRALAKGLMASGIGYLTPSLKLKRNLVMRDYAAEVLALYSGTEERPTGADHVPSAIGTPVR